MLPERDRRLLTAYVDGELPERDRRQVEALLARSDDARGLLHQLEADSARLRHLPCPALPADLSARVLDAIARRRIPATARSHRTHAPASAYPAWLGLAAAAAVLLMLGSTSYFFLSAIRPSSSGATTLARGDEPLELPTVPVDDQSPDGTPEAPPLRLPPLPGPDRREKPVEVAKDDPKKPIAPSPAPEDPVVTAPSRDPFEIKIVQVAPPTILKIRELDQETNRRQLLETLSKSSLLRIELPCRNASRAFERLQGVGRELRFGFVIDAVAQARIKTPQLKANYALFAEDLTTNELATLLQQLGAEERRAIGKRPADAQFDRAVVSRVTNGERKEFLDFLGVDPTIPVPPRSLGPLGTDPTKPLSELTADQVSETLKGQGGTPRTSSGTSGVRPPEHFALVQTYPSVRQKMGSAEVKRFLDARKPARSGTIQALLVLRTVN